MNIETFIVQLNRPLTTNKIEAFKKAVIERGGTIKLVANKGAFVISIDHIFSNELRAMSIVKLIGGVGIRKHSVPPIKKRTET
ncbi:MAG: hypothetical protein EF812_01995 [Methanosarcinales archaeon]|nr:MAG: hypothetical protein EF812_01995 [Methanosarcinales archaeon]